MISAINLSTPQNAPFKCTAKCQCPGKKSHSDISFTQDNANRGLGTLALEIVGGFLATVGIGYCINNLTMIGKIGTDFASWLVGADVLGFLVFVWLRAANFCKKYKI